MEDNNNWHYRTPNEEELKLAIKELENKLMRNTFAKVITEEAKKDKTSFFYLEILVIGCLMSLKIWQPK